MGVVRRKASGKYPVVDGFEQIPDSGNPRGFREFAVTDKAWNRRREECATRDKGRCAGPCKRWLPFPEGDACHIQSTGAGGDDSLDNLKWKCRTCHQREHSPRVVPRRR